MKPVPIKVNGNIIGYGFIDDTGQLHIRLEETEYYAIIAEGTLGKVSVEEK